MKVTPIIASRFLSDGGTMFGLVPKAIWSRLVDTDVKNRIKQDAHVLLVELDDGRKGLIDTGCGPESKFTEKEVKLHGLGKDWPLEAKLLKLGLSREAIDFVVFSHLHWDHAGGASCGTKDNIELSFPNAVHYIHAQEWKDATSSNPLLYKSYPRETIDPLISVPKDQFALVKKDEEEILPGISLIRTGGHTKGHCMVQLSHDTGIELEHTEAMFMFTPRNIIFAGDVCPLHHNLRMVFQTSYDTYPLETRKWKTTWLPRIARNQTLLMFDHDAELFGATIKAHEQREFVVDKTLHTALSPHHAKPIEDLVNLGKDDELDDDVIQDV